MTLALRGEAAEVALGEAQAVLALVQDDERRGRLADLVAAVQDGELDDDDAQALEELIELGLQSGRIRGIYGPEGEQAALKTFRRLPGGRALEACGADVLVVDRYRPDLLDGVWLVVVVDREQGERVSADANERHIFCNVEDVPELCTFILPALHRRGDITVAVSTGGASPVLAQWLRDRFASQIGFEHEQLATELRRIRPWVKQRFETYEERRDFFRDAVARALG